ncbi:MAG: SHOCT domain-containing protein [Candidatus Kapaibacterium sp.]
MMDYFGSHGWGMMFGWVIGLAVLIGIILLIAKMVSGNRQGGQSRDKTPLEILKERYARGEIDSDEYEQRKRKLL